MTPTGMANARLIEALTGTRARTLELVGFPEGDPAQPARPEHQSSSSSQLCCSSAARMARKNAAA